MTTGILTLSTSNANVNTFNDCSKPKTLTAYRSMPLSELNSGVASETVEFGLNRYSAALAAEKSKQPINQ